MLLTHDSNTDDNYYNYSYNDTEVYTYDTDDSSDIYTIDERLNELLRQHPDIK